MIRVIKHGNEYNERQKMNELHTYKCDCGCTFVAPLSDFFYTVVGHGQMDYVANCPECSRHISDRFNRVD